MGLNSEGQLRPPSLSPGTVRFADPPVLCSPQDCLLPSGFRVPSVQSRSDRELGAAPRLRAFILPPGTPRTVWSPRNRVRGTRVSGHERDVWAEMRTLWQKGFLSGAPVDAVLRHGAVRFVGKRQKGLKGRDVFASPTCDASREAGQETPAREKHRPDSWPPPR